MWQLARMREREREKVQRQSLFVWFRPFQRKCIFEKTKFWLGIGAVAVTGKPRCCVVTRGQERPCHHCASLPQFSCHFFPLCSTLFSHIVSFTPLSPHLLDPPTVIQPHFPTPPLPLLHCTPFPALSTLTTVYKVQLHGLNHIQRGCTAFNKI